MRRREGNAVRHGFTPGGLVGAGLVLCFLLVVASCNPFAPAIETGEDGNQGILGDQRTVEGVFQNFWYAYTFKDTTIYGQLLHRNFVFTYRDFDKLVDVSWGRDEDMLITDRMFKNATNLNLVWNNIVGLSGDSLTTDVTRSFNLVVTFNPTDVTRVDGRASFRLVREHPDQPWQIDRWRDESNF